MYLFFTRYENEIAVQLSQIKDYKKQVDLFKNDLDKVTESRVQLLGKLAKLFSHYFHHLIRQT